MGRSWGILLVVLFFVSYRSEVLAFDRIVGTLTRAQISETESLYRVGWGAANLLDDQTISRHSSHIICRENPPEEFWSDCYFSIRQGEMRVVADFETMVSQSLESLTWSEVGYVSVGNPDDPAEPLLRRILIKGVSAKQILTDFGVDNEGIESWQGPQMSCENRRVRAMTRSGPSFIAKKEWRCEASVREGSLSPWPLK